MKTIEAHIIKHCPVDIFCSTIGCRKLSSSQKKPLLVGSGLPKRKCIFLQDDGDFETLMSLKNNVNIMRYNLPPRNT